MTYRLYKASFIAGLSALLVWLYVDQVSLDFYPIIGYFDELRSLTDFWEVLSYSAFGNMFAGIPFEYSGVGDSYNKTMLLYVSAAALRALVVLYWVPVRYALFYLFTDYIILELNQARLSIALTFLFIFVQTNRIFPVLLAGLSHLSVLPILPLYYFKPKRLLIPFFVLVTLGAVLSAEFFPRYFAGEHGQGSGVPLNTVPYFAASGFFYYLLWRHRQYVHDFYFFLYFALLILVLTRFGFSTVYVGRVAELCWHIVCFRFLVCFSAAERGQNSSEMSKNRAQIFLAIACLIMFALGVYRVLLLDGNIWSYF